MWPWQRNGEQPSHTLVRRLLFLSSVGHAFVLMFLFMFYHDGSTKVSRDVIAVLLDTDVTIVKVPLAKVMHKSAPVVGSGKKAAAQASVPAKKEIPPETALSKPKAPKVAAAKKKKAAKPKKETKHKKEKAKPKEPEKPKLAKAEPKKVEEKKPEPPQPIVEQKIAQIEEPLVAPEQLVAGENVVYVGQQEYEALEVQRQIQEEAQRYWKAPPGVCADVGCQVMVRVNHDGSVREVVIEEESGVLMFDVRARQAVSQMEFPRGAWGKEVVVYFKQS